MAIVDNNDLTRGLRGKVGKFFVFRSLRGKTIASHAPRKPDPRKQSAAQRQTRTMFREAAAWAVQVLRDPKKKQFYQDRAMELALPNAYTAAVRAYLRKTTETEERESIRTRLYICKPVFGSIQNGKVIEWNYQQPDREARQQPDGTSISIQRRITYTRGPEKNRTPAADVLRAKEILTVGQRRLTPALESGWGRRFALDEQEVPRPPG